MNKRQSGILLHITSLPSFYGIGDLGPRAHWFADLLHEAGQTIWQMLPVGPTTHGSGNSPYSSYSAFAGNPLLISPDMLVQEGYLVQEDLSPLPEFPNDRVDYGLVQSFKDRILARAFTQGMPVALTQGYREFKEAQKDWLEEFAFFAALKKHFKNKPWYHWPRGIRLRKPEALTAWREQLSEEIEEEQFYQFLFDKQWKSLVEDCRDKEVQLIGDIPIYVSLDSCDVWQHPRIFQLNDEHMPVKVAGVPPDYFSDTGQLWGNPLYDWDALKRGGYDWWIHRFKRAFDLFDILRLDHFRGFAGYWEVDAGAENAIKGCWQKGPGRDFFREVDKQMGGLSFIAEDLGYITEDVHKLRDAFSLPGMRVLLFGFGGPSGDHPFVPHNYIENCVVYTGTHDNNTIKGWYKEEATNKEKNRLRYYLGKRCTKETVHWDMIRMAMRSIARLAVFPLQDVLGLDESTRMNTPSRSNGNWEWRLQPGQITSKVWNRLAKMTSVFGRGQREDEEDKGKQQSPSEDSGSGKNFC